MPATQFVSTATTPTFSSQRPRYVSLPVPVTVPVTTAWTAALTVVLCVEQFTAQIRGLDSMLISNHGLGCLHTLIDHAIADPRVVRVIWTPEYAHHRRIVRVAWTTTLC